MSQFILHPGQLALFTTHFVGVFGNQGIEFLILFGAVSLQLRKGCSDLLLHLLKLQLVVVFIQHLVFHLHQQL